MFSSGFSAWIWYRLPAVNRDHWSLILDLVPAPCCEPGPLWSHRNSFSLYIVCFPSLGIFIAMRYNTLLNLNAMILSPIYVGIGKNLNFFYRFRFQTLDTNHTPRTRESKRHPDALLAKTLAGPTLILILYIDAIWY